MGRQRSPARLRSHTFILVLNICLRLVWSTCQQQWSIKCLKLLSQTPVLVWSEPLCTLITPFIFPNAGRRKPQQGCLPNLNVINLSKGNLPGLKKQDLMGCCSFSARALFFLPGAFPLEWYPLENTLTVSQWHWNNLQDHLMNEAAGNFAEKKGPLKGVCQKHVETILSF